MAFASVRSSENCIIILHSLARYVAPLGEEASDALHNHYFAFKGERSKRRNPPTLHFQVNNLASLKCRVPLLGSAIAHFGIPNHNHIIPIGGLELEEEVPRALLLPHKWAAELLGSPMLPGEFLQFISDKLKKWSSEEREDAKFLTTWALAACGATVGI